LDQVQPVIWFGGIRAVSLLLGLGAMEVLRRRLGTRRERPIAWTLVVTAGLIIVSLAGFGLARSLWVALSLFWLIGTLRSVGYPLLTTWLNLRIDDPQVRATVFSVTGQADAIGQIIGGPGVGAIGNISIRAALVTSAAILTPVIPLYGLAIRRGASQKETGRGKTETSTGRP
jgi:DHA3 family tetracycline resistance protein-like MFS transporter